MIRPQRNRQRQAQAMQNTVQPGQRVRTTAGMYATVIEADDQDVVLEVAPGVQMRFLRRAVMDVLPDDDGTGPTTRPVPRQPDDASGGRPSPRGIERLQRGQHRGRPHRRTSALRTDRQPRAGPRGGDTRTEGQARSGSPKR